MDGQSQNDIPPAGCGTVPPVRPDEGTWAVATVPAVVAYGVVDAALWGSMPAPVKDMMQGGLSMPADRLRRWWERTTQLPKPRHLFALEDWAESHDR